MPIGYSDLKNVIRLPTPWDAGYLMQWQLKDGTTFDKLVADIGSALLLFNRGLGQDYWGQYLMSTGEQTIEDPVGGAGTELGQVSEYGRPDPIHTDATGHMLPLKDYGGALGWTYLALRRAIRGRLDNDVRRLIEHANNTWQKRILERLFKSAAETVGNTGKSVPFADGGVADADFVPAFYNGKSFLSTHNHFARTTFDATGRTASLKAMAQHLLEHGIPSPYDLIIPEADIALWAAQTEFKKPLRTDILTQYVEVRGQVPEDTYLGILETDQAWFRVKYSPRLPTAYAGAFKPTGFGSPNAPLAVRYEPGYPLGLALVGQMQNFPLEDAIAYFTFGVGVNNRVAGVATYYTASGNYTDPTIS